MKIKTSVLQEMMSKSIKGAGYNKSIPITSLLGIHFTNNLLTLMTTDGSNHLKIKQELDMNPLEGTSDFYTIVDAEIFAKLVARTTSEVMILTINDNYLEVKGNGTYKLEIPMDEDGNVIKFPDIRLDGDIKEQQISVELLKNILSTAKVSVAVTMEVPCLTGYYLADKCATTNREMMCCVNNRLLEEPILLANETAELLQLLDGDNVILQKVNNQLLFSTQNIEIYAKQLEGLDIYPVKAIENLMNLSYDNYAAVNKQELLNVLERMSIFVSDYDKNGIYLAFTEDGLQLTSQKSNASEIIEMDRDANKDFVPFRCLIDIEMLKSQVQINLSDIIKFYYGQEKSIKIVDGNTTMIICLLDEEN